MSSRRRQFLKQLAKLFDVSILIASFVLAAIIVYSSPEAVTLTRLMSLRITLGNCLLFALLLVTWHNIFVFSGLYVSKRLSTRRAEALGVAKATLLASVVLFLSAKLFHIGIVNQNFVLMFWACCTGIMVAARFTARPLLVMLRRRGKNSRFLLIVGTNTRAIEFADRLSERPELGYKIVGFVDDDWQ